MKIYSSILVLLIMFMYLKPCTDKLVSKENIKLETLEKTANHQDTQSDGCSPFCSCSCCSIRVVPKASRITSFIPKENNSKYNQELPSKPIEASLSILQPPQLV
ncbi:hypothetical protein N9R54_00260 [Pelobium sp.]|nr:hypothetical protein [Pelobium sp.]